MSIAAENRIKALEAWCETLEAEMAALRKLLEDLTSKPEARHDKPR